MLAELSRQPNQRLRGPHGTTVVRGRLAVGSRAPRAGKRPAAGDVAALVRAAAAGDERSWDALVAEFGGLVWAVAKAHRLNDADAADVSQAAWIALLENIDRLTDPGSVGAWLATTARRECLRVLRHGRRQEPLGDAEPDSESAHPAPGDQLLCDERDRLLRRAFSHLRERDQALLRMLTADPAPAYEEISAALQIPVGSIGPTRARALERLRTELHCQGTLTLLHG